MNVKVSNLMLRVNETSFYINMNCTSVNLNWMKVYVIQKLNHDECWCEYKGLDDWSSFKDNFILNPCACDKACKIDEF